jgi:soluble lytic murein transglycosylase-like protein
MNEFFDTRVGRALHALGWLALASVSALFVLHGSQLVTLPRPRAAQTGNVGAAKPLTADGLGLLFVDAAKRFSLNPALLQAVARVESNFNPHVVSAKGAMGLMQLMPLTARAMGVGDAFDARENVFGSARYLDKLARRWRDDPLLTIASYNAGPGAVQRYHGVPPFGETRRYVRRVSSFCTAYSLSSHYSAQYLPSSAGEALALAMRSTSQVGRTCSLRASPSAEGPVGQSGPVLPTPELDLTAR